MVQKPGNGPEPMQLRAASKPVDLTLPHDDFDFGSSLVQ